MLAFFAVVGSGTDGLPFDLTQLLQAGIIGLILVCILFRKYVVPEWTLKDSEARHAQEIARAEREREALKAMFAVERDELSRRLTETRAQLERLQAVFEDQMIPTLTRATEINARYTEEMQFTRYSGAPTPPSREPR